MLRTPKMFFEIHRGLGKAQPLYTCARNAHAYLRHGDWGQAPTPASFRATHKNSFIYVCVKCARPCLWQGCTGIGASSNPCEFSCYAQKLDYIRVRETRTPACGRDGSSGEAVPVGNGGVGRNCGQPGFWRVSLSNLPKSRPFTFLIHKVNYYCAGVFVAYALLVFYGKF